MGKQSLLIRSNPPGRHRVLLGVAVVLAILPLSGCASSNSSSSASSNSTSSASSNSSSSASGQKPYIILSNAFIGNGWRQTMVDGFEAAAKQAQADGLISKYETANAPGANSATEQISQLTTLILKKPDAILINPASSTALDPVIQKACDAKILVVVFDSAVDAPCAYVLHNNYSDWGNLTTLGLLKAINYQGNVINVRGVVGSQPETEFYDAEMAQLAKYPNVHVVATVNGFGDPNKTQQAVLGVLGSLPKVDAVIGLGGLGAALAFQSAGRPIPVVCFETSGQSLTFWKDNNVTNGSIAILTDPGQSIAAMWEAIDILSGKSVPKNVHTPLVQIPQQDLAGWLKVVTPTGFAAWHWTQDTFRQQVQANLSNSADVLPGVPTP